MEITVCIGSSCHLKGSRDVVAILQRLIDLNGLKDQIELKGAFCMGECAQNGVCVCIDGGRYKGQGLNAEAFFNSEVLKRLHEKG